MGSKFVIDIVLFYFHDKAKIIEITHLSNLFTPTNISIPFCEQSMRLKLLSQNPVIFIEKKFKRQRF